MSNQILDGHGVQLSLRDTVYCYHPDNIGTIIAFYLDEQGFWAVVEFDDIGECRFLDVFVENITKVTW